MSPLSTPARRSGHVAARLRGEVAAGGNGFVAAFIAGIVFAVASRGKLHETVEFTEDLGMFASFLVWAIFGALLLAPQLAGGVSSTATVYAVLSLTLVRIVPVALAMIGTGLRPASLLFMGWFGPRGLASVVFTLIASSHSTRVGSSQTR